jgi:hypothetical protein
MMQLREALEASNESKKQERRSSNKCDDGKIKGTVIMNEASHEEQKSVQSRN